MSDTHLRPSTDDTAATAAHPPTVGSRRRLWAVVGTLVLLLAAGGVAGALLSGAEADEVPAAAPATPSASPKVQSPSPKPAPEPPITVKLSLPAKFKETTGGTVIDFKRDSTAQSQTRVDDDFRAVVPPFAVTSKVTGAYTSPGYDFDVEIMAATGDNADYADFLLTMYQQFFQYPTRQIPSGAATGPLGGAAGCHVFTLHGKPSSVYLWSDRGSFGILAFRNLAGLHGSCGKYNDQVALMVRALVEKRIK
ncbi:hypothetical protein F4553_001526 [Allocatelliglobosispora scoriae]|uniref:Uncharacterized protein n=1 Tax=Allocatelliglobosispora scoriae TaxID=643052 RepID=A0A841BGD4_9ACTN|nr:hypothetical protein [Allocatelliglobosispora scoriae]MBB5868147.1 hypothetical protein [Allocatelliglobosispora scoriae]